MGRDVLLVADESPLTRAEVANAFAGAAEVDVVACGHAADVAPLARGHRPAVILVDAGLEGMNPHSLVRELEQSAETRESVVVFTCPREMPESEVAELEASGALLVLVKPLTRDGLLHAFAQALADSRERKSLSQPRRRRRAA